MKISIMTGNEFPAFLSIIQDYIQKWRAEGADDYTIQCRLLGWITAASTGDRMMAYTTEQLDQIFDIKNAPEAGTSMGQTK